MQVRSFVDHVRSCVWCKSFVNYDVRCSFVDYDCPFVDYDCTFVWNSFNRSLAAFIRSMRWFVWWTSSFVDSGLSFVRSFRNAVLSQLALFRFFPPPLCFGGLFSFLFCSRLSVAARVCVCRVVVVVFAARCRLQFSSFCPVNARASAPCCPCWQRAKCSSVARPSKLTRQAKLH